MHDTIETLLEPPAPSLLHLPSEAEEESDENEAEEEDAAEVASDTDSESDIMYNSDGGDDEDLP